MQKSKKLCVECWYRHRTSNAGTAVTDARMTTVPVPVPNNCALEYHGVGLNIAVNAELRCTPLLLLDSQHSQVDMDPERSTQSQVDEEPESFVFGESFTTYDELEKKPQKIQTTNVH